MSTEIVEDLSPEWPLAESIQVTRERKMSFVTVEGDLLVPGRTETLHTRDARIDSLKC